MDEPASGEAVIDLPHDDDTERAALGAILIDPASVRAIAARLFPPPDPVNHCKRGAIALIDASDRALRKALDLRETADDVLFDDLGRLWIHPTRAETLLGSELAELRAAVRELQEALDLLTSARSENEIRFYDERIRERQERET